MLRDGSVNRPLNHCSKGLDELITITFSVPAIGSVPFSVLVSVVLNSSQVRPVKIIPVVITSPIHITLRASIIIAAVRIPVHINSRAGIYN